MRAGLLLRRPPAAPRSLSMARAFMLFRRRMFMADCLPGSEGHEPREPSPRFPSASTLARSLIPTHPELSSGLEDAWNRRASGGVQPCGVATRRQTEQRGGDHARSLGLPN